MAQATKPFDCLSCGDKFMSNGVSRIGNAFEQLCMPCRTSRRERICSLCEVPFMAAGTTRKCMNCRKKNAKPCRDCGGEVVAGNRVYCLTCECIRSQENRFNLPRGWYVSQLEKQNGVCAICNLPEKILRADGNPILMSVDHDHSCCPGNSSCGRCVRSLLCRSCNSAIGLLQENVDTVISAAMYLTRHQVSRVTSEEVAQTDAPSERADSGRIDTP